MTEHADHITHINGHPTDSRYALDKQLPPDEVQTLALVEISEAMRDLVALLRNDRIRDQYKDWT